MAYYLYQVAYTPEAWGVQIQNPHDLRKRVQAMLDSLGARIEGVWYAFGEYDLVVICEYPDNVSAAAGAIAIAAGGAAKVARTTPLMTIEEGLEALSKAADTGYRPPD